MQSRATGIADHILPLGDLFMSSMDIFANCYVDLLIRQSLQPSVDHILSISMILFLLLFPLQLEGRKMIFPRKDKIPATRPTKQSAAQVSAMRHPLEVSITEFEYKSEKMLELTNSLPLLLPQPKMPILSSFKSSKEHRRLE